MNTVAPGPVETELFTKGKSDEQIAAIAKMKPFSRLGSPDDIASVVDPRERESGRAVTRIAILPRGTRPFRTVIDPASNGSAVSFPVVNPVRE